MLSMLLAAAICHSAGGLPDPQCTPGIPSSAVTQANVQQTICRRGYTATVRPPLSYTEKLKRKQIKEYGNYNGPQLAGYQEDHLISLEVGGDPRDPRNLWPQALPAAKRKDQVEHRLHAAICAGRLTLAEAQHREATNWRKA